LEDFVDVELVPLAVDKWVAWVLAGILVLVE
jgi:hypothetical protein